MANVIRSDQRSSTFSMRRIIISVMMDSTDLICQLSDVIRLSLRECCQSIIFLLLSVVMKIHNATHIVEIRQVRG
ncbi:hypothetical protein KAZ93_03070 [Patescibacteria group bacterium]|nr:hypothetical protein [Patescibacteria group bacterium]